MRRLYFRSIQTLESTTGSCFCLYSTFLAALHLEKQNCKLFQSHIVFVQVCSSVVPDVQGHLYSSWHPKDIFISVPGIRVKSFFSSWPPKAIFFSIPSLQKPSFFQFRALAIFCFTSWHPKAISFSVPGIQRPSFIQFRKSFFLFLTSGSHLFSVPGIRRPSFVSVPGIQKPSLFQFLAFRDHLFFSSCHLFFYF